jgi:RNA polymerase sigma-70 factor (ECF subfamily)
MMLIQKTMFEVTTPSDEELALNAQTGSKDAFVLLYERYFPSIYARARFKIPESDVEDVTQEIFIAVLKSLGTFKCQAKFSTWIWTITNHKIADYYRSRKIKPGDESEYEDSVTRHLSIQNAADQDKRDDLAIIQHAMRKLPKNYQEILLMRFVDDLPFSEIAHKNEQSLEATKSLFRRAMAALTKETEDTNG